MKNLCCIFTAISLFFFSFNAFSSNEELQKTSFHKSYGYERVGDYKNAINSLIGLYKKTPKDYILNLRLGYLYYLQGSFSNAKFHYLAAKKISPNALSPQLGMMRISNVKENFDDAELLGYKVIKKDFYNYYANLYLSYALRKNKKYDNAAEIDKKMLDVYPDDTTFLLEYGLLKFQQKDYAKTKEILSLLLVLEPENVSAKEVLSQISQTQG
ncbi:tetratricopeptide repeat protein [uncultured Shewanella sp.]|uniref:tetratricopeptide repeat protein n=1 Tax=uncultured Shewanella sp. TaxID=173975 RepID=UPI0026320E3A|nr:tetratricopeptide repeat protein [uncultured Shewanella sp.]